jgi:hypothetical protein
VISCEGTRNGVGPDKLRAPCVVVVAFGQWRAVGVRSSSPTQPVSLPIICSFKIVDTVNDENMLEDLPHCLREDKTEEARVGAHQI